MKIIKILTIAALVICFFFASFFTFFIFSDDMKELRQFVFGDKHLSQNVDKLLESLKRNSITFKISGENTMPATGQSKFGGMPDVPKDFKWPNTGNGLPLSFLAQINCSEIKSLDKEGILPSSGILYFFCELSDMDWEITGNDSSVRVLYYNPDSQDILAPRPFPDNLAKKNRLPAYALNFEASASFPSWGDLEAIFTVQEQIQLASTDEYEAILEESESQKHNGRLLGYADLIQNSMLDGKPDPGNAVLLFQLNSCDTPDGFSLMIGDCGNLYFYIQRDDLSRLDFSKIRFEAQCY